MHEGGKPTVLTGTERLVLQNLQAVMHHQMSLFQGSGHNERYKI